MDTSTTSIALIGRNTVNFGLATNENFVALLQHFSSSTPPPSPLAGQIWFNSVTNVLNFYDGKIWNTLSPPFDGDAGTAAVMISSVTPNIEILVTLSAGKIINAVSNFALDPADLPVYAQIGDATYPFQMQFPNGIGAGITMAVTSDGYEFHGRSTQANALTTARTISISGSAQGSVQFDGSNDVVLTSSLVNVLNANVTAGGYYTKVQVSGNGLITDANVIVDTDIYDALGYTPPSIILFNGDVTGNTVSNGTVWSANISLNPSGNITPGYYSNVYVGTNGLVMAANNDSPIPRTGIIIWPNPSVIPQGWAECNGQSVLLPDGTRINTIDMTGYVLGPTIFIQKIS